MSARSKVDQELAEIDAARWDELLERLGRRDAYLLRGYVESSCLLDGGRPAFFCLEDDGGAVVFPCSVRAVPGSAALFDVTTPYGYGGPVASGSSAPVGDFWSAYERWCSQNRVVSTFFRFHPLFGNRRDAAPGVRLERLADTTAWGLDGDDDLFAAMHRHHRRAVRKAERLVDIEVHEGPERLDDFAALYEATMRRQGAPDFYFFPQPYWELLAAQLPDVLVRFDASLGEEIVASILCLATPPWLHYHLGATADAALNAGAMHALLFRAAGWARERGFREFHLGGGVGGREDSLFDFKRRFSPAGRREMWIGKAVHDAAAYEALAGPRAGLDGFFPAYRG